jgi:hypothetical protein
VSAASNELGEVDLNMFSGSSLFFNSDKVVSLLRVEVLLSSSSSFSLLVVLLLVLRRMALLFRLSLDHEALTDASLFEKKKRYLFNRVYRFKIKKSAI